MGRKLTSFERSQRQREKDRERERNAARRDRERRARASERERERVQRKRANEAERAARKRAKEEELEDIRREAEQSVAAYQDFVSNLKSLHLNKGLIRIEKAIRSLSKPNPFDEDSLKKPVKPEEPEFTFKARKFTSPDQAEFDKLTPMLSFDIKQYAAHIGKKQTTLIKQIVWIGVFAVGAMFLLTSYDNTVAMIVATLMGLGLLGKLIVIGQIMNGNDKSFASPRGYEIFMHTTKARHEELSAQIARAKEDFRQAEATRESDARQKHEKKVSDFRNKEIPRYENEFREWGEMLALSKSAHESRETKRDKWVWSLGQGNTKTMTEACELMFPVEYELDEDFMNSNPSEFDIGYQVAGADEVRLCVSLPSAFQFLPDYEVKMKPSGKESTETVNSEAKQNEASAAVMSGAVMGLAYLCFKVLPTVSKLQIELNGFRIDPSIGEEKADLFIVLELSREDFSKLKLDAIDPVEAVKKLARGFKKPGSEKELEPLIDRDEILWSTADDEAVELDPYISELFYKARNR